MKYKLTILTVPAFLFLSGCVVYTIINYSILAKEEGWGIVYMVGLFAFGSTSLIVDLVIQLSVKNNGTRFALTAASLIIYLVLFFMDS